MRAHRLVPRILLGVGLTLICVGACVYWSERQSAQSAEKAMGKIVKVVGLSKADAGSTGYPLVQFQTKGGQSVQFRANVPMGGAIESPWSKPYQVGQSLPVLYDPARPEGAVLDEFFARHTLPLWLGMVGALPCAIGGVFLVRTRMQRRRAEDLRQLGRRVQAKVTGIAINDSLEVNGRSPWRISAEWRDPANGTLVTFRSVNIWIDPAPFLGGEVSVFVDHNNVRRYAMDLDFLPEDAV